MRYFTVFLLFIYSLSAFSQETKIEKTDSIPAITKAKGIVVNGTTLLPLPNVHVVNSSKIKVTVTNGNGQFEIDCKVNDTIMFSYLGFETYKIKVTHDLLKNEKTKIILTEKEINLNEVVVSKVNLTGFLEVDTKLIHVDEDYRANISGLPMKYEVGNEKSPNAVSRVLGAVFNPIDFLHNTFSKKATQMKKLNQMRKDDALRNLLNSKFDRETLAGLLEIDVQDISIILEKCNYSQSFIKTANDLQILDAISSCYEEQKSLKK